MIAKFERFVERFTQIEYVITVPLFLTMLILMFIQVMCRYVFKLPLGWSEEALRFIFVAATYLGAAIATKERAHIEINIVEVIIDNKVKTLAQKMRIGLIVNVVRDILTTGVMGYISYLVFNYTLDIYSYHTVSTAILLPMWIVVAFMFSGIVLCTLHSICLIILNLNGRGPTGYEFGGEDTTCSL